MLNQSATWRQSMQQVSADVDEEFGETLTIVPCRKPNGNVNLQAVPIGPEYPVVGVFRLKSEIGFKKPAQGNYGVSVGAEVRTPMADFSIQTLASLPTPLQDGDQIIRASSGYRYEVTSILSDGVERVVVHINQMGRGDQIR